MKAICNSHVVGALLVLLGLLNTMGTTSAIKTSEYFFDPEDLTDISNITWAHAVNSKALLEEALNGDVMMLEADISLGTVNGVGPMPIMAHPPADTSDLSFDDFITRIIEATESGAKKGAKLDFKDIKTVEPCLQRLKELNKRINFPVWLNADILPGPVNATGTPVNASQFMDLTRMYSPSSMLSLGWTTNFGCSLSGNKYEKKHIDEMVEFLDNYKYLFDLEVGPTFPVRTGLAAESLEELTQLLASIPRSTLTLWGSASDPVNMDNLHEFIDQVKTNKLYIDLPFDLISGPGDNCNGTSPLPTHTDSGNKNRNSTDEHDNIVPNDIPTTGGASVSNPALPLFTGLIAMIFYLF